MSNKETRTVRVRATVEYDLEVPIDWSDHDIEFHRNEGTYCADRIVEELRSQMGTDDLHHTEEGYRPCMCGTVHFEVLDEPVRLPIRDPRMYL